jgi:hypothetical protein
MAPGEPDLFEGRHPFVAGNGINVVITFLKLAGDGINVEFTFLKLFLPPP